MKQKILYTCLFVLIVSILPVSCVKEDYTGCVWVQPLKLTFAYDMETDTGFNPEVSVAHIYLFDQNGVFINSWTIENPDLSRTYDFELETPPGTYEFITWFNQDEPYYTTPAYPEFTSGITTKEEAGFHLTIPEDKHIRTAIPHLLYGHLTGAEITTSGEHTFTIPVAQQTNTIRLTVKGLPEDENTYGFSITDNNGSYTYNCTYNSCEEFTYITNCTRTTVRSTEVDLTATLTVLKLDEDRSPKIRFTNQTAGEELYPGTTGLTDDLVKLILDNYPKGVDFNKRSLFDITLEYDDQMNVDVNIEVWGEKKDDYEIL